MDIIKTEFTVNLDQMIKDMHKVLEFQHWPIASPGTNSVENQISLRHRLDHESWLDGIGSLKDKDGRQIAEEKDFCVWNKDLPEYTKNILDKLQDTYQIKFGRVRYMRLAPKIGLSVHYDFEYRYHLALITNKFAMFGHYYDGAEEVAKCYHVPSDSSFYKIDTRVPHFVYNASLEDRIHLVCCVIK